MAHGNEHHQGPKKVYWGVPISFAIVFWFIVIVTLKACGGGHHACKEDCSEECKKECVEGKKECAHGEGEMKEEKKEVKVSESTTADSTATTAPAEEKKTE